jgi:hypothetical protein
MLIKKKSSNKRLNLYVYIRMRPYSHLVCSLLGNIPLRPAGHRNEGDLYQDLSYSSNESLRELLSRLLNFDFLEFRIEVIFDQQSFSHKVEPP